MAQSRVHFRAGDLDPACYSEDRRLAAIEKHGNQWNPRVTADFEAITCRDCIRAGFGPQKPRHVVPGSPISGGSIAGGGQKKEDL